MAHPASGVPTANVVAAALFALPVLVLILAFVWHMHAQSQALARVPGLTRVAPAAIQPVAPVGAGVLRVVPVAHEAPAGEGGGSATGG
jgi:hypothetical protein